MICPEDLNGKIRRYETTVLQMWRGIRLAGEMSGALAGQAWFLLMAPPWAASERRSANEQGDMKLPWIAVVVGLTGCAGVSTVAARMAEGSSPSASPAQVIIPVQPRSTAARWPKRTLAGLSRILYAGLTHVPRTRARREHLEKKWAAARLERRASEVVEAGERLRRSKERLQAKVRDALAHIAIAPSHDGVWKLVSAADELGMLARSTEADRAATVADHVGVANTQIALYRGAAKLLDALSTAEFRRPLEQGYDPSRHYDALAYLNEIGKRLQWIRDDADAARIFHGLALHLTEGVAKLHGTTRYTAAVELFEQATFSLVRLHESGAYEGRSARESVLEHLHALRPHLENLRKDARRLADLRYFGSRSTGGPDFTQADAIKRRIDHVDAKVRLWEQPSPDRPLRALVAGTP